ncbi:hypothetical protein GPECTOR_8g316 [Gonium pectorale]|uniref:Uncharacterized protein n=1 Tax=Gonium pectorale TaxID=33097 RepID=A0A150GSZ8_GONPE|nr:hypothetical protein GPECTOR_8g316 [Gonium pectorale]|eukprot:KXZ52941.1 hypothetical protein GPECTOR_8g316 [Gonium pectorale]
MRIWSFIPATGSRLELSNLTLRLPPLPESPSSAPPAASLLAHVFAAGPGAQLRLSGVTVEAASCGELAAFATQLCDPGSWRHTTSVRVLGPVVQYDSGSMPIAAAALAANASVAEAAAAGSGVPYAELAATSFTCPESYPPPPSWPCTATTAGNAAELRGVLAYMASTSRVLLVSLTGHISLDETAWDARSARLGLTIALYGVPSVQVTRGRPTTTLPVLFETSILFIAERVFWNATLLPYSLYDGPPASLAAAALGSVWPVAVGMSAEEAMQIDSTFLLFSMGLTPAEEVRGTPCWEPNPGSVIFLSATSATAALGRRVVDYNPMAYMMGDGMSSGCSLRGINAPGGPRVFYDLQGLDYKLILMGRGALTLQNLVLYNLAPAGPTGHESQELVPPPSPAVEATTDAASVGHGYGGEDVGDGEPIATGDRLARPPVDRAFGDLPTPPLTAVPRWAQPLLQLAMPLWYFELNR